MNYMGWEIVKMISENILKDTDEIIAHINNIEIPMILNIESGNIVSIKGKKTDCNFGLSWLFQAKSSVYYTLE